MRLPLLPLAIIPLILCSVVRSQTTSWSDTAGYPLIRFTAAYGINNGNAESENIDFHYTQDAKDKNGNPIAADLFTLRGEVIEPTAELLFTVSIRPTGESKSLNLRVGRMWNAFRYVTVMPQTLPDGSPGGDITVESTERFTVIPISLGASISTPRPLFHVYADVIYAMASMSEEQRFTLANGSVTTLPTVSYNSNGVGFRLGVGIIILLTKQIGIVGDWGYRGLGFYNFSARNGQQNGLDYSVSGSYGTVGLSFGM